MVEVIDAVVGQRRSAAAASVGTHLGLATVNRIVALCSMRAFRDWWETTAVPRFASGEESCDECHLARATSSPTVLTLIGVVIAPVVAKLFRSEVAEALALRSGAGLPQRTRTLVTVLFPHEKTAHRPSAPCQHTPVRNDPR